MVFDEIDKAEDHDFLYTLLEDLYKKSIILITNFKSWLLELDERIKSRLVAETTEFKQYNEKETSQILKERLQYAFFDGVWGEAAFNLVAKKCYELKDIRSGLFLLKESALQCEEQSKKKIEEEHVNKAIAKLDDFAVKSSNDLDEDARFILKIIKENSGKKIGDLFRMYEKEGGKLSYKTFQRKLARMDEGKYISLKKEKGAGGNTTIVNKKLTEF